MYLVVALVAGRVRVKNAQFSCCKFSEVEISVVILSENIKMRTMLC